MIIPEMITILRAVTSHVRNFWGLCPVERALSKEDSMMFCRMCIVIVATLMMTGTSALCTEARLKKASDEAIAGMEKTGATVCLAPGSQHALRIEISEIVFGRTFERRNGHIVVARRPGSPARLSYHEAVAHLPDFPELEQLSLWGTPVSDDEMVYVELLKRLRFLNLSGTNVTDRGIARLAGIPSLEELILGDTFYYDGSGDLSLTNARNYRRVRGIRLTDKSLSKIKALPNLRLLNLRGTAVSDAGLAHLKDARGLRHINLVETTITDRGLAYLYQRLPLEEVELVDMLPMLGHAIGTPRPVTRTLVTSQGVLELKDRLPRCLVVYGRYLPASSDEKQRGDRSQDEDRQQNE
jgi:hypothetical protein